MISARRRSFGSAIARASLFPEAATSLTRYENGRGSVIVNGCNDDDMIILRLETLRPWKQLAMALRSTTGMKLEKTTGDLKSLEILRQRSSITVEQENP